MVSSFNLQPCIAWLELPQHRSHSTPHFFSAFLAIIGLFNVLLVARFLRVICSFQPYAKIRGGKQSLLERRRRESELLESSLRCVVPCTNHEPAATAFKDIAGEGRELLELIIKIFCSQKF